jgi:uncharacterized membrane protein YtjA (UPF0391 family)
MKGLRLTSFILMTLGVLLFVVGLFFKIQHWPDMFKGKTSGSITVLLGVILFIITIIAARKNKK